MNVALNDTLEKSLNGFLSGTRQYVLAFTAVLIIIQIAYQISLRLLNPDKEPFEAKMFTGIGLAVLGISFYGTVVELLINQPMQIIDSIIEQGVFNATGATDLTSLFQTYSGTVTKDQNGLETFLEIDWWVQVVHLFVGIIARLAMYLVFIGSQLNQAYLYALGIFVFPFSLIINNRNLIGTWFFSFLAAKFTIPVCKVLVMIATILPYDDYLKSTDKLLDNDVMQAIFYLIMEIFAIFVILSSSQIASRLISSMASPLGIGDIFTGKATLMGIAMMLNPVGKDKK